MHPYSFAQAAGPFVQTGKGKFVAAALRDRSSPVKKITEQAFGSSQELDILQKGNNFEKKNCQCKALISP